MTELIQRELVTRGVQATADDIWEMLKREVDEDEFKPYLMATLMGRAFEIVPKNMDAEETYRLLEHKFKWAGITHEKEKIIAMIDELLPEVHMTADPERFSQARHQDSITWD